MADDDHALDGVAQHHGFIAPINPWPQPGNLERIAEPQREVARLWTELRVLRALWVGPQ